MGEAILAAVLGKKQAAPGDISVADISAARRDYLKKRYGVAVTESPREAVKGRDIVVLAVKPQNIPEVLADLKGCLKPAQLVLSIAAGISIATIARGLGHGKVVRAMPNTPAQIGLGMSGWTATTAVTSQQKEWSRAILDTMGKEIYFDDETSLDMVTAVSGSGPAYLYLFAEAMVDAAVNIGLSRQNAEALVSQTVLGASQLLVKSGKSPAELRRAVTSRGGTTERAVSVFKQGGLAKLTEAAVRAAYLRARELGSKT
jgi:pyrroline-5-carboxylate reductase